MRNLPRYRLRLLFARTRVAAENRYRSLAAWAGSRLFERIYPTIGQEAKALREECDLFLQSRAPAALDFHMGEISLTELRAVDLVLGAKARAALYSFCDALVKSGHNDINRLRDLYD
jgi:hypothetical protein